MERKIIPVKGTRPSKRKCVKRDTCESYGYCSFTCPDYKKILPTPSEIEKEETNEYRKHLNAAGLKVIKNRPPFIQTPTPPHLISVCLSFFDQEGYEYVDAILINNLMPMLIFKRK